MCVTVPRPPSTQWKRGTSTAARKFVPNSSGPTPKVKGRRKSGRLLTWQIHSIPQLLRQPRADFSAIVLGSTSAVLAAFGTPGHELGSRLQVFFGRASIHCLQAFR